MRSREGEVLEKDMELETIEPRCCAGSKVKRMLSASGRAVNWVAAHPLRPERHQLKQGLSFNNSFNNNSICKTYLSKELKALPTHSLPGPGWAQLLDPGWQGA